MQHAEEGIWANMKYLLLFSGQDKSKNTLVITFKPATDQSVL